MSHGIHVDTHLPGDTIRGFVDETAKIFVSLNQFPYWGLGVNLVTIRDLWRRGNESLGQAVCCWAF
jgi:hypothetical protein